MKKTTKQYRRIRDNSYGLKKGKIYPEDLFIGKYSGHDYYVRDSVKKYPNHWELVEDKFVLPEEWYVKIPTNKADIELLYQFKLSTKFDDHPTEVGNYTYVTSNGAGCGEPHGGCTKITFEQFKEHVMKKGETKKVIIGYKLKDDCEKYSKSASKIAPGSAYLRGDHSKNYFPYIGTTKIQLSEAGVLDLWFEPVYEKDLELPKIGTYKVEDKGDKVKYGCMEFKVKDIKGLHGMMDMYKISDFTIDVDGGIEVTADEVKQIVKYYDEKS